MATTIDIASMAKNREVRKINGQYVEVFPETKAQYVTVDDWQGSAAKLSDVLSSLTNVVYTSGNQTISGEKTFTKTLKIYTDQAYTVGTANAMLTVRYKNADGSVNYGCAVLDVIGTDGTDGYNVPVSIGSANGTTHIGSGESRRGFLGARGFYNNESLYLSADGNINLYTNCANDNSTYAGPVQFSGTASASGGVINVSGLGTVTATTFTGALSGNASTATKLAASKTIAISGGATGTATAFDGSGNITIPVTALDVSKASAGTLPVDRGGTGLTSLDTFVRTTGDQTVSGVKTFSGVIEKNTTPTSPVIQTETDAGVLRMWGGATSGKGGYIALCGKDYTTDPGHFYIAARDASNSVSLHGEPDGTLTWDGKGFVYTSTAQDVGGVKTFTSSPAIKRVNPYLDLIETDWEKGTAPSAAQFMGVRYYDKNNSMAAALYYHYYNNKSGVLEFLVNDVATAGSSGTASVFVSYPSTGIPNVHPEPNNTILLGTSNYKWKEIWCTQSSINSSSDERIKQQIASVPDAVLDAWGDVDWIQFKYNDSVAEKGADKARLHNGLIAQRVDAAFKAHGLDASKYGLFLYDAWDAQPEEKDEDGTVIHEAQPAGDGYGLRYTEALCMEAAFQRRRADRAEARIAALEQRLDEMETVIATLGFSGGDQE